MSSNISTILSKDIDILENNELTINLEDETVIISNEDIYQNVLFIKLRVLSNRSIKSVDNLKMIIINNPNLEVMVKQINMEKLSVGIITKLSNICICNNSDCFVNKLDTESYIFTELCKHDVYNENNDIDFTVILYSNYSQELNLTEYLIKVYNNVYTVELTYGSIKDKITNISFVVPHSIDYNLNNKSYDKYFKIDLCNTQYPDYVMRILRLLDVNSINLIFGNHLKI